METGFLEREVVIDGVARPWVVFVPRGVEGPLPAVLFLHGRGECGDDGLRQTAVGLGPAICMERARWPFLVVFPQKVDADGEWFDERPYLDAVLHAAEREFSLSPGRRYLTGISQGGRGAWRLATHLAWRFSAVAAVCGWCDPAVAARELSRLPVWAFHGERDPVIPMARSVEVVDALRAAGADARLTLYPDLAHNAWTRAYRDEPLPSWFLQHGGDPLVAGE